jgi:hypothetical protein
MPDSGPFAGEPPVVDLDSTVHVSPYALFRWLRSRRSLILVDVRPSGKRRGRLSLVDAVPHPERGWLDLPPHRDVVLFDDDGDRATHLARRYRQQGHLRVRSLFGGLSLYDFALDPQVVGSERHLSDSATPHK